MPRIWIFLSVCLLAPTVLAQPTGQRTGPGEQQPSLREQRRVELREMLKSGRPAGFEPDTSTSNAPPQPGRQPVAQAQSGRHLTPQERFELREQLRREQIETRKVRQ